MPFKRYRIEPKQKVSLEKWDPQEVMEEWQGRKEDAEARLAELVQELDRLQEKLYAGHQHKLLIVIQAMDTGGKDGTIRSVFSGVNPQGVRVASFKAPTPEELDHDYLWRIHQQVPGRGEIVIFNRSHYESLLVERVHKIAPEEVWQRRYEHVNEFERMMADEGLTMLKFYLHISLEEQRQRLLERIDDPSKQWKFNPGDLEERKLWPQYMQAFEDVLERTSTQYAPWYVIPANRNWYRNLVIASVVVETLQSLNLQYPPAAENIAQYRDKI
ncbi:MAG TPA: polyphosphate kinase 2 family protein [Anaerolineaceae bacterium]|nr:polyphosphate kinase 2 family protein [Anaerolineaceae bacterium]